MVCDSCQSKVKKVIVPDKWKEGSRNAVVKAGKTNKVTFCSVYYRNISKLSTYSITN